MIRLLHLADVHLGAPLGGFETAAESRSRELLRAFRRIPDLARREKADALLIAGDLFDGPRPPDQAVAAVRETVRRLREAGVHVFAVPGNHDALPLDPGLYDDALDGAVVFREPAFGDPVDVDLDGERLHVYGLAHDPAEEPEPLSTFRRSEAPGHHVVLLHGSVPDAPHWEGGASLRLPLEALAALEADYIALGDHHAFRPPGEFPDGVPACYSGSFAGLDRTEVGPRGVAVVELAEGRKPAVRLRPSGVKPLMRVEDFDVTRAEDELSVADRIAAALPGDVLPIVRLVGEPSFPLDPDRVRIQLRERCGWAAVEDETRYYDSGRLEEVARQRTVAGHVARLGLRRARAADDEEERRAVDEGLRIALRALGVR